MTWEQRMSDRAQIRIQAERDAERARMDSEWEAEKEQARLAAEPRRLQGPPQGCHECYKWHYSCWTFPSFGWLHRWSDEPDHPALDAESRNTDLCFHGCHVGHGAFPRVQWVLGMAA